MELDCSDRLGYGIHYPIRHGQIENWVRLHDYMEGTELICTGSHGEILVELYIQVSAR